MALFGLDQQKPRHFRDMFRIAWENRDQLPFAWRILRDGVCDGCALGTSGLKDWTLQGTHLCMVRLELLRLNTAPALDPAVLRRRVAARLDDVGGAAGAWAAAGADAAPDAASAASGVVTWDEALDRLAAELRTVDPARAAVLHDLARDHQRGVLRRAEGGPRSSAPTTSTMPRACATPRRRSR